MPRKRFMFFLVLIPSAALAQAAPPPRSPFTGEAAPVVGPAPAAAPPQASAAPTPAAAPAPAAASVSTQPPTPKASRKDSGPEARTGFQMHVVPLVAVSFPFGDATDAPGDSLSARYSWQWMPFEVGLGGKVIEPLYVGGYLNVAAGYEGGDQRTERRCEAGNDVSDDVSCSATSVHLGLELRYAFTPGERLTGWVGYGAGYAVATQSISDAGHYSETSTAQGIEFARLSGGLDLRATRGFGLGPFAIVSIGRFVHARTEVGSEVTFSGDIENPALHAWLSIGLRLVIFP